MSKGHHAHRRRAYGRRQHELRERRARRESWDGLGAAVEVMDASDVRERFEALRSESRVAGPFGARWLPETGW